MLLCVIYILYDSIRLASFLVFVYQNEQTAILPVTSRRGEV